MRSKEMCVLPLLKLSPASAGWHWGQRGKLIFCLLASCRYCLASHEIKACTVSCFKKKIGQAVVPRVTGREENKLEKERCAPSINFLIASLKTKNPKLLRHSRKKTRRPVLCCQCGEILSIVTAVLLVS